VDLLRRRLVVEQSLAEVRGVLLFGPTKTHAARRVPLTATLAAELEDLLEQLPRDPDALLFPGRGGEPLRHGRFYRGAWQPALQRCGLPHVGVHVLRHSAAAALIASAASPKAVQSILGHRSAAFTLSVYGHLFDADMDDVASRLDVTVSNLVRDRSGIAALRSAASVTESGL
jgi:integrase